MREWKGGGVPFGYKYDKKNKKLIVDETESLTLKKIFSLYASGYGINKIADYLNKSGYKTRRNKLWHNQSIAWILSYNRILFYLGFFPDGERGNWKPLITKTLAKKIHRVPESGTKKERSRYLLPHLGIFKCAYCGGSIKSSVSNRVDKSYQYYLCTFRQTRGMSQCPNSKLHKMDEIDSLVMTDVIIKASKNLAHILKQYKDYLRGELLDELAKLQTKKGSLTKALKKLVEDSKKIDNLKLTKVKSKELLSVEEKQNLLIAFVKEIRLSNKFIEIEYLYPIDDNYNFVSRLKL